MKSIQVSEETHRELRLMDKEWEGADSVLQRLIRFYKKHHGSSSPSGVKPIHTKARNPDDIKVFIRKQYEGKSYHEMIRESFDANQQKRLGIRSIVNTIFNFPKDERFEDRATRAESSLKVTLKNGPHARKFKETSRGIFQLNEY